MTDLELAQWLEQKVEESICDRKQYGFGYHQKWLLTARRLQMKQDKIVEECTEELYSLNAGISLRYVGLNYSPTRQTMLNVNERLGVIIKKLRSVQE